MTESTQPAGLSKSAPAVDMSRTFSARVMALPLPEPQMWLCTWKETYNGGAWYQWHTLQDPMPTDWYGEKPDEVSICYTAQQLGASLQAAAEIAAEADALAKAAEGLRVALRWVEKTHSMCASDRRDIRKALAAYTKATGEQHAG